jgi:hypothetical protein
MDGVGDCVHPHHIFNCHSCGGQSYFKEAVIANPMAVMSLRLVGDQLEVALDPHYAAEASPAQLQGNAEPSRAILQEAVSIASKVPLPKESAKGKEPFLGGKKVASSKKSEPKSHPIKAGKAPTS